MLLRRDRQKGGSRRLNVLFTRSRWRMVVFASMSSADVVGDEDPGAEKRRGAGVMKRFLEYAERKGMAESCVTGLGADSPPETEIVERLRYAGFVVDLQVGSSGYRIDLAVRHPQHPTTYLAGIEFDGASYHSGRSVRDCDRIREAVLRDLGWNILRIWSTDWFADPEGETRRLVDRLSALARAAI